MPQTECASGRAVLRCLCVLLGSALLLMVVMLGPAAAAAVAGQRVGLGYASAPVGSRVRELAGGARAVDDIEALAEVVVHGMLH